MDEEEFDIVDASGHPTGEVLPRSEVHRRGLWHQAAHVWVVDTEFNVLLQKRSMSKDSFPGRWDVSCAGHLSAGEESEDAALRELREEIGVTAKIGDLEFLTRVINQQVSQNGNFIDNEFNYIFLLNWDIPLEEIEFTDNEVTEAKYITLANLEQDLLVNPDNYYPHPHEYNWVISHLKQKIGK